MSIDPDLVAEWEFMLREAFTTIDAVLGEMKTVSAAAKANSPTEYVPEPKAPMPTHLAVTPNGTIEARATFRDLGGDRLALFKDIRRKLEGDPVHGGAVAPIKIVMMDGREVIAWDMEEVHNAFGAT